MTTTTLRIDDRYHGFPGVVLGGFAGGLAARRVGSEAEVTFQRPIPTGEHLEVAETDDTVELRMGEEVAATATTSTVDIAVPEPVSLEDAEVASASYRGHREHPYPSCFTCGPERPEGDGLRVFPAPVGTGPERTEDGHGPAENGPLVAAAWMPHPNHAEADGTLPPEIVWASADCSSIWPVIEAAAPDCPDHVVTGRLAVRIDEPIRAGEPHVVTAWPLDQPTGRRLAAAAILDEAGAVKAVARHTLVVTDWGVPLGVAGWGDQE